MAIAWRKQMSIGIKSIDEDHQNLLNLINSFEEVARRRTITDGEQESLMRTMLARLQSYAHDHFSREERLQMDAGYAGLEENQRDHIRLSNDLAVMVERFQSTTGDPLTKEELLEFLNRWLINHIIKVDLKMRGQKF
jgi:hemerythrin-like metal-binding protein